MGGPNTVRWSHIADWRTQIDGVQWPHERAKSPAYRSYHAAAARNSFGMDAEIDRLHAAESADASDENGAIECVLRPYVWAYGMTTGRVDSVPLVIPLPARPKQLLTFSFADPYCALSPWVRSGATPRLVSRWSVPSRALATGLSVFGRIDNFTIHFQPSGFNRLFGIPMTELTDAAYDAHAVIGPEIPSARTGAWRRPGFAERIQLIEKRLIRMLGDDDRPDPVAIAANRLFASHGIHRVSAMATDSGLSHGSSRGVSSRRSVSRRNSTLESSDSTPPWITSSDIPAVLEPHRQRSDYYDQMHSCTTAVLSRARALHGSWRNSTACPRSTRSSRLRPRAQTPIADSLPDVASLLSGHAGDSLSSSAIRAAPWRSGAGVPSAPCPAHGPKSTGYQGSGPPGFTTATSGETAHESNCLRDACCDCAVRMHRKILQRRQHRRRSVPMMNRQSEDS